MSFVVSESRRDLDFHQNKVRSVGPNVGPGSYTEPQQKKCSSESRVPFGSGARRRINTHHVELMHDITQFRIIPAKDPKYF